jgi:hypothetical protein
MTPLYSPARNGREVHDAFAMQGAEFLNSPYVFGDTRVATLALFTLTALSGWRS